MPSAPASRRSGACRRQRRSRRTCITAPIRQRRASSTGAFLSDSIVEWKRDRWLLAAALDYGTEKQAHLPGQPRATWAGGAIWVRYAIDERMSVAFRPEFYRDPDGLITGASRKLTSFTATFKYQLSPRHHRLVGTVELRHDRSTRDAEFARDPNDRLTADQTVLLFGILWTFEG